MIPRRRKRPKMGVRVTDAGDIPAHRAFVRRHTCCIAGCFGQPIEAAHVRAGIPDGRGGVGMKPHDKWCVPLCEEHHAEQHRIGEPAFDAKYNLDRISIAKQLWKASSARVALERKERT